MIEIRNITKIYHSKTGASVKALDNVSVSFPETGMVFILGKSGSGKSTLLNVIGGLDGCDSGEFIIKGKSSKNFAGSDFDAYRNTFIGFIFQEYNVLDDFSVGANIGLALELQGKKATSERISEILSQVEMLDYAKRKPNELSGGQKQRVAIARALVKDPEIIMADEPTGALDSNTGKQIFDTLKELSKTKLVIVVSHDTDFAEKYGDRIIEMKDGRIFRDITKHEVEAVQMSSGILKMSDNLLRIEKGYQLTAEDLTLINEYLAKQNAEILISGDQRLNDNVRSEAGISQNNCTAVFNDTDPDHDIAIKEYDGKKTKFIKSRLPMKNALKMGSSSLGHKKFRLVMTIILSLVAFALFGFADTLGGYDKVTAATESIVDSYVQNASFSLSLKETWDYGDGDTHENFYSTALNEKDIKLLSEKTGLSFVPVFNGSTSSKFGSIPVTSNMLDSSKISSDSAYTGSFYGFTAMSESQMRELGLNITGEMPKADDEIAISKFMFEQFNYTGFKDAKTGEKIDAKSLNYNEDDKNSIIGKYISVSMNGREFTFEVTAVIDTLFDYSRYNKYIPSTNANETHTVPTEADTIVDMIMQKELQNTLKYSFHAIGYVTNDTIDTMSENMVHYGYMDELGTSMNWNVELAYSTESGNSSTANFHRILRSSDIALVGDIEWIDDNGRLDENEVLINKNQIGGDYDIRSDISEKVYEIKTEVLGNEYAEMNIRDAAVEKYISDATEFAKVEDRLLQIYKDRYLDPESDYEPTEQELVNLWRELINNSDASIVESKSVYELESDLYRTLVTKLFGESEEVSDYISNNYRSIFETGDTEFSLYNAKRYLAYKYVYALFESDPDIIQSDSFRKIITEYADIKYWENADESEKYMIAIEATSSALTNSDNGSLVSEDWYKDGVDFIEKNYKEIYSTVTGNNASMGLSDYMFYITTWENGSETKKNYSEYKIAGFFDDNSGSMYNLIISDTLFDAYEEYSDKQGYGTRIVTPHENGIYAFAIAPMPTDKDIIQKLVELNYTDLDGLKFELQNQVMDTLNSFNDFIEVGAKVFLYIGIGFAVFSALMLMNFISVSISYKRREIGILRAVGARSSDVFKIFFSEAAIIALINYVLSLAATITAVIIFNNVVRNMGVNVTLLNFGVRQILLMLVISIFVAAVASFLPVWNIARRKPVDAIKNK